MVCRKLLGRVFPDESEETTTNPDFIPFLFGASAHFPPGVRGKSERIYIDIGQHPVLFSRAVGLLQPDEKVIENEIYLRITQEACEAGCPLRISGSFKVLCKRISRIRAIAESEDGSELNADVWAKALRSGLCKPVFYA
jgi:hypothetical protein